jgi:hypothetical protein
VKKVTPVMRIFYSGPAIEYLSEVKSANIPVLCSLFFRHQGTKTRRLIKPGCWLILFLLFFTNTILAQHYYRDADYEPPGWIFTIFSSFSYYKYTPQPGTVSVKFPYTVTSRDFPNTVTSHNFSAQSTDLIGTGKWVYPSFGLEAGKGNLSVEGQLGMYLKNWSDNLYGGINYRFILKKYHREPKQIPFGTLSFPGKKTIHGVSSFPVKISCGIFYYQPLWKLGTIDIGDQQFKALGYTMQSLDSNSIGSSGLVTVYFHQNILAFEPSFSIGFSPPSNRLCLSFAISPMFNISEIGGLRFYQTNTGLVDWAPRNGIDPEAVIPLSTFGLDATFNGEKLRSTPFHLQAVMYSFKLGIRIVK